MSGSESEKRRRELHEASLLPRWIVNDLMARKILKEAKPGDVIEYSAPEGLQTIGTLQQIYNQERQRILRELGRQTAHQINQDVFRSFGGLGGIAGGLGLLGGDLGGLFNRPADPPEMFEKEVTKHFPKREDGRFFARSSWRAATLCYYVEVWWIPNELPADKKDELVASVTIEYRDWMLFMQEGDWRVRLLCELEKDVRRRRGRADSQQAVHADAVDTRVRKPGRPTSKKLRLGSSENEPAQRAARADGTGVPTGQIGGESGPARAGTEGGAGCRERRQSRRRRWGFFSRTR